MQAPQVQLTHKLTHRDSYRKRANGAAKNKRNDVIMQLNQRETTFYGLRA